MRRLLTILVAALALAGCGYSGLNELPLPGGPDVGGDSYVVTAEFDDVLNLTRDSTVKSAGVTIGRVESIKRDGWGARVELRLRSDVELAEGTVAHIGQTSLLGEKFVDMQSPPSGAGRLGDGDLIPLDRTSRGSEVEEVLGALSLLLNGGGVAQLQTISSELHQALEVGDVDTSRFLRNLDTFVATLDRNRESIVSTLDHVNTLARTVNADREAVKSALAKVGPSLDVLASQQTQLTAMLKHLDAFSQTSSDVVRTAGEDLRADLAALNPVLAELAASGDSLPQALEVILTFPFPDAVLNAVKGDYVNLDVELDLSPLEILRNVSGLSADGQPAGSGSNIPLDSFLVPDAKDETSDAAPRPGGLIDLLSSLLGGRS